MPKVPLFRRLAFAATAAGLTLSFGVWHSTSVFAGSGLINSPALQTVTGVVGHNSEYPTCYESRCDGKDPNSYPDCQSDAQSVGPKIPLYIVNTSTQVGYVELRYSSACDANWSRITRTDGDSSDPNHATVCGNDGCQDGNWAGTVMWSPMTNGAGPAQACGYEDLGYTGTNTGCTNWY